MTSDDKKCCFIGHRTIKITDALTEKLKRIIEGLIVEEGVRCFLFGGRSEFDDLCHGIVTEYQTKYSNVYRIAYTCRSEYAMKNDEALRLSIKAKCFEGEIKSDRLLGSGSAAYVVRNREMIDASFFCVFYYDESYMPPKRKRSTRDQSTYQPKSGTRLAYEYAISKSKGDKKRVINTFRRCDLL